MISPNDFSHWTAPSPPVARNNLFHRGFNAVTFFSLSSLPKQPKAPECLNSVFVAEFKVAISLHANQATNVPWKGGENPLN